MLKSYLGRNLLNSTVPNETCAHELKIVLIKMVFLKPDLDAQFLSG